MVEWLLTSLRLLHELPAKINGLFATRRSWARHKQRRLRLLRLLRLRLRLGLRLRPAPGPGPGPGREGQGQGSPEPGRNGVTHQASNETPCDEAEPANPRRLLCHTPGSLHLHLIREKVQAKQAKRLSRVFPASA